MSSEEERKQIKDIATEVSNRVFNERPDEVILQELKDAYDRQWDLKDSTERKATGIVTISGIITSLLFGFAGFLHNNASTITYYNYVIFLVTVSIVANVAAVLFSVMSLKIKDYRFMFTDVNEDAIIKQRLRTKPEVIDTLIREYHYSVKSYPLSRHRFCVSLGLFLSTTLSSVLIAAFISWVFAAVITTDSGIPFLSVNK